MPKYELIKEYESFRTPKLIDIIKDIGEKGFDISTVYIETELDYTDCHYRSDRPNVSIKVYGEK